MTFLDLKETEVPDQPRFKLGTHDLVQVTYYINKKLTAHASYVTGTVKVIDQTTATIHNVKVVEADSEFINYADLTEKGQWQIEPYKDGRGGGRTLYLHRDGVENITCFCKDSIINRPDTTT